MVIKLIACMLVMTAGAVASAGAAVKPSTVSLFYYVASDPAAPEILRRNASRISIIAPQTFTMDAEGFIMGEVPAVVKEVAREHRIAIMPLVVNGRGFQPDVMHAVLDDPARQDRAIRYMLYYSKRDGAVGFQFDYENIHYTYRDKFTAFTRKAARAFHGRGLQLSLAVVGRWTHERNAEKPGGWDYWSGVYDYKALARVADFLSIMAYPQHEGAQPGPIASLPWIEPIVEYTLSQVPRHKISLGIPVYHSRWFRKQGDEKWQRRGAFYRDIAAWAAKQGTVNTWDEELASGRLQFVEDGQEHVVWYEDARSVRAKLALMRRHRLPGFSAWVLGREDPGTWEVLDKEFRAARYSARRK